MNRYIYLSSSWKNRERVRALACALREELGFGVYDFTDPASRAAPEIPPERFPDQFDPTKHVYKEYLLSVPEWGQAVACNRRAIDQADTVILMLPCGLDAHADAYYGLGRGAELIVCGQERPGQRTPTHLWATALLDRDEDVVPYFQQKINGLRKS